MDIDIKTATKQDLVNYIIEVMTERNDYAKQLSEALERNNETLRKYKNALEFMHAARSYMDSEEWIELVEQYNICI